MRGNVHLEKMREKAEEWGARIGCMSRVNEEMEVNSGRLIWELLARPAWNMNPNCGGQEGKQHARTWKKIKRAVAGN